MNVLTKEEVLGYIAMAVEDWSEGKISTNSTYRFIKNHMYEYENSEKCDVKIRKEGKL